MKEYTQEEISNSSLYELIEMYITELKNLIQEEYTECRLRKINKNLKDYVEINLSNWNPKEKESLFIAALKGINHFYFISTNKTKLPIDGFNSIMNAINGENYVYVNSLSIKWFPIPIKNKIKLQNIKFKDLNPIIKKPQNTIKKNDYYDDRTWLEDVAGSNDPDLMNDVYWNLD